MELEEVPGGAKVTIFYKHDYLEDAMKAELFLSADEIRNQTGMSPTISSYFHEIGVLFGLEYNGTVDWEMTKEIPDEYMAAHPECKDPKNFASIYQAREDEPEVEEPKEPHSNVICAHSQIINGVCDGCGCSFNGSL
jgi:hypothetical protein